MENKFRIQPEKTNEERVKPKREKQEKKEKGDSGSGSSIFSGIERRLKLETYFEEGFPVQYLPKILFVLALSLIYIGNTHHAEKTVREINRAQSEVEDLRADYTTLKAEVMYASKQSEVARRVKDLGLRESLKPPFKIVAE